MMIGKYYEENWLIRQGRRSTMRGHIMHDTSTARDESDRSDGISYIS